MKPNLGRLSGAAAIAGVLLLADWAAADTAITTFDDFALTELFAWSDATVVSGPASYSITDTGFGSGYKDSMPQARI